MLNLAPDQLICRVITLVIAFTFHEFAHAFIADRLGDLTPREAGRLTLNPLVHLDIFGSLLLLVSGFGWAKPTPINPAALRQNSRYGLLWVSLSGPLSNFVLAAAAAIPLRLGWVTLSAPSGILPTLGEFLYVFMIINLSLMVFNLIPLPPLDGEKILTSLLPDSAAEVYAKIQPYGPILFIVVLFVAPLAGVDVIGWIMTPLVTGMRKLLIGV